MQLDCVLEAQSTLAEGPVWDPRAAVLWWVNIPLGELHRFDPQTGEDVLFRLGEPLGAAVPRRHGGLVLALGGGFAFFDPARAAAEPIAHPEADRPGNRFNDGKCDPAGRFWAGTMPAGDPGPTGSLYCLDPDLHVERRETGVACSNGLAWTRDARTMFYIDTPTRVVSAYDYDLATGAISNRRPVVEIPECQGWPDGMTIDDNDNLWIALWGGSAVVCQDPRTGKLLERIDVPVTHVTSCAFGGPDWRDLYITTARARWDRYEPDPQPLAGNLFRVRLPLPGRPTDLFAG